MYVCDHIGLYVKDLEYSVKYYQDLFGFKEYSRLNDNGILIVFMDMGTALLQLKRARMPIITMGS
jgi:catechol 2,3-dioxygenase-like lactoylglutathione lyase family enzyme